MEIRFNINLHKVSSLEWHSAYEGVKRIVNTFPLNLMRLKTDFVLDIKRLSWSEEVIFEMDGTECISFSGDLYSQTHRQTFLLFKDLEKQKNRANHNDLDGNVYYAKMRLYPYQRYENFEKYDIFQSLETFEEPYTICIQAIGIYLEHCFYQNSYLCCDTNLPQLEAIILWLNHTFNTSILSPKILDHEVLWDQVEPVYKNTDQAIYHFMTLSVQSEVEKFRFISGISKIRLESYLINDFRQYSSLEEIGAIITLSAYLEYCGDLDVFVIFSTRLQNELGNSAFTLEELLLMLLKEGICDKPFSNEMLIEFNKPDPYFTCNSVAHRWILLRSIGASGTINFTSTYDELLEVFAYHEPHNGLVFKKILDNEAKLIHDKRIAANTYLNELANNQIEASKISSPRGYAFYLNIQGNDYENYIIRNADAYLTNFNGGNDIIKPSDRFIKEVVKRFKSRLKYQEFIEIDHFTLLKSIYEAAFKNNIIITSTAWYNIEKEHRINILVFLKLYMSDPEEDNYFQKCRRFILENKEFWIYFT